MNMVNKKRLDNRKSGMYIHIFIIIILIALMSHYINAQVEITNVDMPSNANENSWLNISFTGTTDLNESVMYSIYENGIKMSDKDNFSVFLNYSSSGIYTYTLVAQDSGSRIEENYTLEVTDMPLAINILSPISRKYGKRDILVNITTSNPVDVCNYYVDSQNDSLNKVDDMNFEKIINLSGDGIFQLSVNCNNIFDNSTSEVTFNIDTSTPVLTSKSYTIDNNYDVTLNVATDTQAICKYDTIDADYNNMSYFFSLTNSLVHSTTIDALADGNYNYYVRCKNILGNAMPSSEIIAFTVAQKLSASISIDKKPPLKAGTYEITLLTSRPVQNNPTLYYVFNNDNSQRPISLTGSGNVWKGYMIITDDTADSVGTFHFSGIDFNGVSGNLIKDGEIFLIDTIKPIAVTSLESTAEDNGDIQIRWYYDNEDVKNYKIYRSTTDNVDYVDYYDTINENSGTSHKYIDNNVDPGVTYYYKVSATDEADNDGILSDVVSALSTVQSVTVDQATINVATLKPDLIPKVDAAISDIDKMIMDVQTSKNALNDITDNAQLSIITLLKLSDKIDMSLKTLQDIESQATSYKSQDITASELDVRLNKLRLDAIKAQTQVVEDIKVEQSSNFDQITQESDVNSAISAVTEGMNLSKKSVDNYTSVNKKLQDSITIRGEILTFRVKYLGMDDYLKYSIVKKTITSTSSLKDIIVIESIPKEIEKKASNLVLDIKNQQIPIVVQEDPVLKWSYGDFSSAEIYYQVNDVIDLSYLKNSKTVVLTKPDFKYSDSVQQSDNESGVTGFTSLDAAGISKLSLIQWLVVIGICAVIFLGGYYFVLTKQENNYKNQKVMSHKIIAKHAIIRPSTVYRIKPVNNKQNESSVGKNPTAPTQNDFSLNNKDGINPNTFTGLRLQTNAITTSGQYILSRIEYCNTIINGLNYEKARLLYNDCVMILQSDKSLDKHLIVQAKEMMDYIYLKLYSYKSLHEAKKHLYYKRHEELNSTLLKIDNAYSILNQNLTDIEDTKVSDELKFMIYLSESRNQLERFKD